MKLGEHVEHIRQLIDQAFRNRLGRMGINEGQLTAIENMPAERKRIETIREVFIAETGTVADAYEKLVEELTFTLFNRLAALKVMEAHTLHPEIVTRRESHGGRSFAHLAWLEQNHNARNEEAEGLLPFLEDQLQKLATDIPLFSPQHPYHLLPTALELQGIINAFNQVETDTQVETEIWKSDDVLGWLYEGYQAKARKKLKEESYVEYNKVHIQSCVYTPRWVVQFLVDNSLGKLYLEMYPDSQIRHKYKIAHSGSLSVVEAKPLHKIRMIDPSTGSGNYLLYGFDMYYDLYIDQIENYGADYNEADVPKLIIENNLHGVDLDDRAIQLAQLGLYIKAKRKKRTAKIEHFNIVSSDFFLPAYNDVKDIFEDGNVGERERKIIEDLWEDLENAHKFGSLIRLEEKLHFQWFGKKKVDVENQLSILEFDQQNLEDFETFRNTFFTNLQKAVAQNTAKQGQTFLNTKTQDAITFLQLLTQKYDVVVANPPYLESDQFGDSLGNFIKDNFIDSKKFGADLYSVFYVRCFEFLNPNGFLGIITPNTFMHLVSFKDLRELLLKKTIQIFVDVDFKLFNSAMVTPVFSIYNNKKNQSHYSLFIKLKEEFKDSFINNNFDIIESNASLYKINQSLFNDISDLKFIYWVGSKRFLELLVSKTKLSNYFVFCNGIQTGGNNEEFFRAWWEINHSDILVDYPNDNKKWVVLNKGGKFQKWYGNLHLVVEWKNNGEKLKNLKKTNKKVRITSENYYFKEGLAFTGATVKGFAVRYQPENCIFEIAGKSIFSLTKDVNIFFLAGLLNTTLSQYLLYCINPTVNFQTGDLEKLPYVKPHQDISSLIATLSKINIELIKTKTTRFIYELNFISSPLILFPNLNTLKERIMAYLNYENVQQTQVLINEAIINELIFEVYELSDADREQVEVKMGVSIGALPVLQEAKDAFLAQLQNPLAEVTEHIEYLAVTTFDEQQIREIKEGFSTLYQSNNDLEEFCIRHQVNPINVWYWFKGTNVVPAARAAEIALEFLADSIRTLLQQDDDGIIPLVGLPGEEALSQRLEQHCLQNGFTAAQYMQLDSLLGRSVNEYLEHHFFNQLSNHLNLFMYLPKTPFIWHLSSGQQQGFEAYILIYKWNRDSLFKLKSQYISQRVQNLEYRQIQLQDVNTAQAQTEKEKIRLQLHEIEAFKTKIDELIAEGYDPKLDDGVGKNIAPLQKKGLLRAEVLKSAGRNSQLEKYLNADW